MAGWFGRHFARSEQLRRAAGYVRGLPGNAERTTGWHLAEDPGDPTPDGVQHLLARADWNADPVRDDLAWYVAEHLGAADGVPVVDETGFLKEGVQSRGAAGRSTGTAGRSESAQVGVLLGYATPRGGSGSTGRRPCRRSGSGMPAGGRRPASQRRSGSPPSSCRAGGWSTGRWRPGCRPGG